MAINPLILDLLEEITESGRSAEDVCEDQPELLEDVRKCLRQLASIRDEFDGLFPEDLDTRFAEDDAFGYGSALPSALSSRPEIPGYSIGNILGRGGMGVVYKARDLRLNRPVAVKMMLNGGFAGPRELADFQREAEALAALRHPNIVQVYDVGESRGLPYFTMEFVDGGNLAQKLAGIPQPSRIAAGLMALLSGAVEAAHRGGIVHRDLKPSNVLLTSSGEPKIGDFGLSRRFEEGTGLSMTGGRVGTPGYMAPEQVAGHARVSGPATDVYALGSILYEMLTGRPPFLAETAAETERQLITEEPVPPSRLNPKVPRDLETICLKCLQKEPKRRYSSASGLEDDLGRFLRGEPIEARPVGAIERAGKWVRRHPTRAVTTLGGLTIAGALLAGGWWIISARSLVAHDIENDLRVATQALRRSDWVGARSALDRARVRFGPGDRGALWLRLDRASRDLDLVGRLAAIRVERLSLTKEGLPGWADTYEKAFRAAGLLDMAESADAAADRLSKSDIRPALVAAIDDWSLCSTRIAQVRGEKDRHEVHREGWLLEVVRKADPDPSGWRDRLREPSVRRNRDELDRLASSARIAETQVSLLVALGEMLQFAGGDAVPFMLGVQRYYPDDLWVNALLGRFAYDRKDTPEALRNFQAALATRPETPYLYYILGVTLHRAGRETEAISYYRKAVELNPQDPLIRLHYGESLADLSKFTEAVPQFELGLELTPDAPTRLWLRKGLRRCRLLLGDVEKVMAVWRRSLKIQPFDHEDWDGYAEFCLYHRREDEYRATCRRLIRHFGATLDAQVAERIGRACLLLPDSGEFLTEATSLIDRALVDAKPRPEWVRPFFMFAKGLSEYRHGRLEDAIKIMEGPASPALQPGPRLITAMARYRLGRQEEALGIFANAILSNDWKESQADEREEWIYHVLRREAEAMMLPKLQDFLVGKYQPRTREERACFLGACLFEGRYRVSAEIYAVLLASDARLSNDLSSRVRYHAACAAALVGVGAGQDAAGLDKSERLRWRNQARDWLRADLELARKLSRSSKTVGLHDYLQFTLKAWLSDPDLNGIRGTTASGEIRAAEVQEFGNLCNELQKLIAETKK